MQNTSIGFIGAGNMAYALISGLINNGFNAKNIKISDIDSDLLASRNKEFGIETFTDSKKLATSCDVIILAVKPQILKDVCANINSSINENTLIISIAVAIKILNISRWLGGTKNIVRIMPNTPALISQGITGLFADDAVTSQNKAISEEILTVVGDCIWVDSEKMLDALAALSGSGPAYFFLMMDSLTKAGIALGLDAEDAQKLSIKTALGASMMAINSDDSPNQLRAKVTSPKGTTQAAIEYLQDNNFESIIASAMRCAFDRARTMGVELGDED